MQNHYISSSPTHLAFPFRLGKLFLVALFLLGNALSAKAQTTWTGATSADWATATNWSAGVPDAADDAVIPN